MMVNGMLALFNFIPLFPLDGFQFVAAFVKPNSKFIEWNQKHGMQTLFGCLLISILVEMVTGVDIFSMYLNLLEKFVYMPIVKIIGG